MSSAEPSGRPQTRVAILDAARRRLREDGYHGTSLESVAREAGVSRQAVYLHFGSKAKLLAAVIQHANDSLDMGDRLDRITEAKTGLEALRLWIELNAATLPHIHDIVVQLDAARRSEPEADALWHVPVEDRHTWCVRIARRLKAESRLAHGWTTPKAADMLWAMTMPRLFEDLTERGWTPAQYVAHVLSILRDGMLRDG